jgi:SAM-dependent methyltransferase
MTTDNEGAMLAEGLDVETLRSAIREEYDLVARDPARRFHFHTGRKLAAIVGYDPAWFEGLPESSIASFAGTGNPFSLGALRPGEQVVDVGCGAGIDSLIAARMVGPEGRVIGVDMTPAMLEKARAAAAEAELHNVEFRSGVVEEMPVEDGWADVVISNGVLNLTPDKSRTLAEMRRVLGPSGRLQIADLLVQKPVPESSKRKIDLWTG